MLRLRGPGSWMFLASLQILFLVNIAEYLYPGYSVSENYISDLGVGPQPSQFIFTITLIIFGLMLLMSAFLLKKEFSRNYLWILVALTGIGALGVGFFNENTGWPHVLFAFIGFTFGSLAPIYAFKVLKPPFSWISVFLGMLGLVSLILLATGEDLGMGVGGMERMVFYPGIFWGLGFGAYLMALESKS